MIKVLLLATGGAIGTILRFLLSNWIQETAWSIFPYGTLGVNVLGSFFIGFCWSLSESIYFSTNFRLFLFVGLFGGFTTFSSFSLESLTLLKSGAYKMAFIYILVSNLLGISAVFLGYLFGKYASAFIK